MIVMQMYTHVNMEQQFDTTSLPEWGFLFVWIIENLDLKSEQLKVHLLGSNSYYSPSEFSGIFYWPGFLKC